MLSSTASEGERVISRQDTLATARRTVTDPSGAKPANQPDEEIKKFGQKTEFNLLASQMAELRSIPASHRPGTEI
jgi:hypothetical protein